MTPKLLPEKVLKISRRYLRPFLSYRENPAGGRISPPAGRLVKLGLITIAYHFNLLLPRIFTLGSTTPPPPSASDSHRRGGAADSARRYCRVGPWPESGLGGPICAAALRVCAAAPADCGVATVPRCHYWEVSLERCYLMMCNFPAFASSIQLQYGSSAFGIFWNCHVMSIIFGMWKFVYFGS